jgi:hypothetical protein
MALAICGNHYAAFDPLVFAVDWDSKEGDASEYGERNDIKRASNESCTQVVVVTSLDKVNCWSSSLGSYSCK